MVGRFSLAALSMILSAQAQADTGESLQGVAKCRAIEDPAERVECYDALAGEPTSPTVESSSPEEQLPETNPAVSPEAPITLEPPTEPSDATSIAQSPAAEPRPAPQTEGTSDESEDLVERFGLEQVETANADELESRLVEDYDGWWGNTKFYLENGQVWQQTQPGRWRHQGPANPKVTIRRRAFSSYRLKVEGSNRTIRVKRIE